MELSIVTVFKSDGGIKDKHLTYFLKLYHQMFPNADIVVQVDDETDKSKQWLDFNKSKQLNLAVKKAKYDNLLILDIDMIISKQFIEYAYERLSNEKFILMVGTLVELDEATTMTFLSTHPSNELPDMNYFKFVTHENKGLMANGCYMITKDLYWKCGGHDERFVGWGSEDAAFILAAYTMNNKKAYRTQAMVLHMWHPRVGDRPRNGELWERKERLMVQYSQALGKKELMRKVIESKNISQGNNIIMTMYIVGKYDVQRGVYWKANLDDLMPLIKSMNGQRLIILNNCFEDGLKIDSAEFVRIETEKEPYRASWYLYLDYLTQHKEIDYVWHCDSTDVEMLKNPFQYMDGDKLYVGSEEQLVGCDWMVRTHPTPVLQSFMRTYRFKKLLNGGLLGGSRNDVLEFCSNMCALYDGECSEEPTNMAIYNYLLYRKWHRKVEFGSHINTKFKAYETNNTVAWWKHK